MEKKPSKETLLEITTQMEYYLSDENLKKDNFFHTKIESDPNGYIDIDYFLKCNKVIKAGWSKNDLIEGIKKSKELELDKKKERVRRLNNKPLPELVLLHKKRKEKDADDEDNKEDEKEKEQEVIDPIILKVESEKENEIKWKDILQTFKDENPNINVLYSRFKKNSGHFGVLPIEGKEFNFKDKFICQEVEFKVEKCEGDDLLQFWKDHGSHFEMCTKKSTKNSNKKDKKEKKGGKKVCNFLKDVLELGGKKYKDISDIRGRARKIINDCKDGEKLEGDDLKFVLDVMKFHHNHEEKEKDLDYITTGKNPKYNYSRCFFIYKKNGEKDDLSIMKCIDSLFEQYKKK